MKATIWREDLLAALERVAHAIPRTSNVPILSHVLIEACTGMLKFRGGDGVIEIATQAACDVREFGVITVPASLLQRMVSSLPGNAQVMVELVDGPNLLIKAGRFKAMLHTLPAIDYYAMPEVQAAQTFTVAAAVLHDLFTGTMFAASTGKDRPNLQGVYLHVTSKDDREVLRAVATNGHMLALADAPLPEGAVGFAGAIVSQKVCAALLGLIKTKDGKSGPDVSFGVAERVIRARIGETELAFKVIDAEYPDYARVLPCGNDKRLSVDRPEFFAAVDRLDLGASAGGALKLQLDRGRCVLSVHAFVETSVKHSAEVSGQEELDCSYAGELLEIGANPRYLAAIGEQLGGAAVAADFGDPQSPILMSSVDVPERLFVVMPMRV